MSARILIVVRWPVGGIRSYLRYSYALLPPDEFSLTLVGPAGSELEECERALPLFQPRMLPARSASLRHMAHAVRGAIRHQPFDLVHSQGYSSALVAALPARIAGIPHIVTIHDMFTDAMRKRWSVRAGRILLASALGLVDIVQPTGAAVEENYRRHMGFWPATRPAIRTIRNGIDVARFSGSERRDLRTELGLEPGDFLIGFLGRFMAIKGFHCLTKAMEHLVRKLNPTRRPVVVAVGSGGFIREDRAFIEQSGLRDNFRFLPFTNDISATLKGMDVVAIPSMSEASPILPMEALVSGVPVVASDCAGLRDVLANTPARLFPVGNAARLAEALRDAMVEPRSTNWAAFRETAADRFDAARAAGQLRTMIECTASRERSSL